MGGLLVGLLVGGSLAAGAVVAVGPSLSPRLAALITAFGGGILLAAVALELAPSADERAGQIGTALGLLGGAVLYVGADTWLSRDQHTELVRRSGHAAAAGKPMPMSVPTSTPMSVPMPVPMPVPMEADDREAARGEAIAAGIVVDGIPESLALGFMVAAGKPGAALLAAVVIGNVTEAYGAAQPILVGGRSRRFALGLLTSIGALLAVTVILGGTIASGLDERVVGVAEAVAAGAILAVLTISIIPYAFKQVSSQAALAAAVGFTTGYLLSSY